MFARSTNGPIDVAHLLELVWSSVCSYSARPGRPHLRCSAVLYELYKHRVLSPQRVGSEYTRVARCGLTDSLVLVTQHGTSTVVLARTELLTTAVRVVRCSNWVRKREAMCTDCTSLRERAVFGGMAGSTRVRTTVVAGIGVEKRSSKPENSPVKKLKKPIFTVLCC